MDIIDKIRSQYDIDVKKINLITLYKIKSPDITLEELDGLLADRKSKWQQSVDNGTNERFIARDQAYLDQAEKFETILRDYTLRHELFDFYSGSKKQAVGEVSKLAKDFFDLVNQTKRINKETIEFFFAYYPSERKNKKSILEYLKKQYKVVGASENNELEEYREYENDDIETQNEETSSFWVSNLFQEKTVMMLRKSERNFEDSLVNESVLNRYPKINDGMYDFLELDSYDNHENFKKHIEELRTEVYEFDKQQSEMGIGENKSFLNFINCIRDALKCDDIRDNFSEFKLLIKYPKLTPYMYSISEIKKSSLTSLYNISTGMYGFRNLDDFLLTYFVEIYDNFGLYVQPIKKLLADAEKNAGKQKILNGIDRIFGFRKTGKLDPKIKTVHLLTYWPVYMVAWLAKIMRVIFENIKYVSIASAILIAIRLMFALIIGAEKGSLSNIVDVIISLSICVIPAVFFGFFIWNSASILLKEFDIIGIDRTFEKVLEDARKRTEEKYEDYGNSLLSKRLPGIIGNFVIFAAIIVMLIII